MVDILTFTYTMADMVNNQISKVYNDYVISNGYSYDINKRNPAIVIKDNMGTVKYPVSGFYRKYNDGNGTIQDYSSHIFVLYYSRRTGQIHEQLPGLGDIFFLTASKSLNKELREELPHCDINDDLTAFYRVKVQRNNEEYHIPLTYEMLEAMNMVQLCNSNLSELYRVALKNTADNMPFLFAEQKINYDPDNAHFIWLNGKYSETAANIFLFPEKLVELSAREDANLFIAPVERNAIRLGSDKMFDAASFDRFLAERNSRAETNDYLSSQIYLYDRNDNCIKKITDNPMISMDGFDSLKTVIRR